MDEETLEALQDSIAHWQRLANGTYNRGEDPYADDCALCGLYNPHLIDESRDKGCVGCPVQDRTGVTFCDETPYSEALHCENLWGIDSEEFQRAAQKELRFLESLLPV